MKQAIRNVPYEVSTPYGCYVTMGDSQNCFSGTRPRRSLRTNRHTNTKLPISKRIDIIDTVNTRKKVLHLDGTLLTYIEDNLISNNMSNILRSKL